MKKSLFNKYWYTSANASATRQPVFSPGTIAGIILIAVYLVSATSNWQLPWLVALQEIELYKKITGLALALFFLLQWRLMTARLGGYRTKANQRLITHRNWGAIAPLLLILHTSSFGHAYIQLLCLAFFSLVSLGLSHPLITKVNRSALTTSWLIIHVALAATLIFLMAYHGFNAFYYE